MPLADRDDRRPMAKSLHLNADVQQRCLNVFRDALQPTENDSKIVQEVKKHLYNRDFASAFGTADYLQVYASRWSPSRALAYLQIFSDLQQHILGSLNCGLDSDDPQPIQVKVVCLGGGGGAELVGFAGWSSTIGPGPLHLDLKLYDVAGWQSVTAALDQCIRAPPKLSKYAATAVKEANVALLPSSSVKTSFVQQDVLEWTETTARQVLHSADVVTLMFTINEMYSASIQKTQKLLSQLTSGLSSRSLLLVVDSPGSYSTVSVNGADKKYPMQWLLDVSLLGMPHKSSRELAKPKWEKVMGDEARWYRLPLNVQYPIELENMRYQIHLYRRLADEESD